MKILKCWGSNIHGQVDVPINLVLNTESVSLGYEHSCTIWKGRQIEMGSFDRYINQSINNDNDNDIV